LAFLLADIERLTEPLHDLFFGGRSVNDLRNLLMVEWSAGNLPEWSVAIRTRHRDHQ
jgi:hypothetical protein